MENTTLSATVRKGNAKQTRDAGFIPGVLHASDASSTPVQFEAAPLKKVIVQHGANAKIWVKLDTVKTYGYIKEVQRSPVEGNIIHVAVQLVTKGQDVKMQLPIVYHGREELENRQLHINIYKQDVEVTGTTEKMPDVVNVDVSKKEAGESITHADFELPKGIKLHDQDNEIYAVIKAIRKIQSEETT